MEPNTGKMIKLYDVTTYDPESDDYTPQKGLSNPSLGVDIHGVRRVLKELKTMGYTCHRTAVDNDRSVLVERNGAKWNFETGCHCDAPIEAVVRVEENPDCPHRY